MIPRTAVRALFLAPSVVAHLSLCGLLLTALCAAPVCAAPVCAQGTLPEVKVAIAFRPSPGSKATKTFTVEHALALQAMSQTENGVEQSSQRGVELSSKEVVRVVDAYRAVADGRPTLLQRLYEANDYRAEIAQLSASGNRLGAEIVEWASPLAGRSVLFTWVPEESGYGKLYDTRDGTEEALMALKEDTDLRGLLPEGAVAVGASWPVAPEAIVSVFAPFGSLPIAYKKGAGNPFLRILLTGVGGRLADIFGAPVEGKFEARLDSVRQDEGARLATIALEVDVVTTGDQRGLLHHYLTGPELARGIFVEAGTIRWSFRGKGDLVWNLDLGRFESLRLAGSEAVTTDLTLAALGGGFSSRQTIRMAGGLKVGAECPRPKSTTGGG